MKHTYFLSPRWVWPSHTSIISIVMSRDWIVRIFLMSQSLRVIHVRTEIEVLCDIVMFSVLLDLK